MAPDSRHQVGPDARALEPRAGDGPHAGDPGARDPQARDPQARDAQARAGHANAALLELGADLAVAVPAHTLVEVLNEGRLHAVPLAPIHCCLLLEWNGQLLPVFDLARWHAPDAVLLEPVAAGAWSGAQSGAFLAVVKFQAGRGAPVQHGCLQLAAFAQVIHVDDGQMCELPDPVWNGIAVSCFTLAERTIPVLSLPSLFDAASAARSEP